MAKKAKTNSIRQIQRAVEKLCGSASARVGGAQVGGAGAVRDACRFAECLYQDVPRAAHPAAPPAVLAAQALSLWQWGEARKAGQAKVRVLPMEAPSAKRGATPGHRLGLIIEIVNDDMPFLVDSVSAALTQRGIPVLELYHPVVQVNRDGRGRRMALSLDADSPPKSIAESYMRVEVDGGTDAKTPGQIQKWIETTLADVRVAVADWGKILGKLDATLVDLERNPPPLPKAEIAEGKALLGWMRQDHFTFLGYREYVYAAGKAQKNFMIAPGSGLGLLRDPRRRIMRSSNRAAIDTAPEVLEFLLKPELLMILKANYRSTVHRPVHLDYVAVKRFDGCGRAVGERRFVGLFTSTAYSRNPRDIPYLRRKIQHVMAKSKFDPASHDGKALQNILETYPRDELLQVSEEDLFRIAVGVLALSVRPRIGLFVRWDKFQRFVSCLVYTPRERFNTALRHKYQDILARAFAGRLAVHYTLMGDEPLARLHLIIAIPAGKAPQPDLAELQAELEKAARSWTEDLHDALADHYPPEAAARLARRYVEAFPSAYREANSTARALDDIDEIERLSDARSLAVRIAPAGDDAVLRLYHLKGPVALSDCLPILENAGFRVQKEQPYELAPSTPESAPTFVIRFLPPPGAPEEDIQSGYVRQEPELERAGSIAWIHEFYLSGAGGARVQSPGAKAQFEEMFLKVWFGDAEDDGFNRLVVAAELDWREAMLLRAYAKYLRQIGSNFSEAYMASCLGLNAEIARLLVALFHAKLKPGGASAQKPEKLHAAIEAALENVSNLDQDRMLRQFLNLIEATVRTSFYQPGPLQEIAGGPLKALALKFNPALIRDLPRPRPFAEISVYSPRVEGVHLRGGTVARGGLRWSDRREDFRTEILGLMKAQMVKNAVIVPVGAKGGFVPKRLPPPANREAWLAEGVASYKIFIDALLDITDNLSGAKVLPPKNVLRLDGDDPYLVVAADKGTTTFSDIANGRARAAQFWLDDAFASGGSSGYDHKKMGITARGAWELVKRHFREQGHNIQKVDFTVIGVGDMSGDVFGNGMLLSPHIKLLAAFDHRHIFIDPDPDTAKSFAERQRLFKLPRSSWADYDAKCMSHGAALIERSAKVARLTPEIKARFAIASDKLTPVELISILLRSEVDLLWLGGIGTYIKASSERHADVGDRANEAVRVNGDEVRAHVVGEGANLGCTQRGRIEFARASAQRQGGRINTDAVDNSAGVDCSDHEVNIKIALSAAQASGRISLRARDALLAKMTNEVAELVLRDNYRQGQALSLAEAEGPAALDSFARFMLALEKQGRLDRPLEALPDDETIDELRAAKQSLTRPELAVLMAYAKTTLYSELLASDLPDQAHCVGDLAGYFPTPMQKPFAREIARHRLRREIVATSVANSIVNRAGITFVYDLGAETGCSAADVARAYTLARDCFDLRDYWSAIEALDNVAPAAVQMQMLLKVRELHRYATLWFLRHDALLRDLAESVRAFAPGIRLLRDQMTAVIPENIRSAQAAAAAELQAARVPAALALRIAQSVALAPALDIVACARAQKRPVPPIAKTYFALGERFGFEQFRRAARGVAAKGHWERAALSSVIDDFYRQQRDLVAAVSKTGGIAAWEKRKGAAVARLDQSLNELRGLDDLDLAKLTVAARLIDDVLG
jgi:glutamate dehydrogenase